MTVLAVGLVWLVVTGLLARAKLQHAQHELSSFKQAVYSGEVSRASAIAGDIRSNADSAHRLVSGPAWWVAANLPGIGTPLATARTVAEAAHDIGDDILPGAVDLVQTVRGSSLHAGTTVHLAPLVAATDVVTHAHTVAAAALTRVRATSSSSWLSSIDHSRDSLLTQLGKLDGELSGASRALHLIVPMMGQSGQRRYFVGFENEGEARGLGGLPGAFAIVTVDKGTFRFTNFGNDGEFLSLHVDVDLGSDYNARYGSADPTGTFLNSDIGPDFRDAARIWAGMWQAKTGQHIDGAVAVDPTALSYLLRVTGPTPLSGGGQVSADNVVALTQQTQYSKFSDRKLRKKYVVAVAQAVAQGVTSGRGSATALVRAFARAAGERRLAIWSARGKEENAIIAAGYGAVLQPVADAPFTGFTVVNAAGSKLDYYLDRTMAYSRTSCAADASATASFTLTNNAPRSGLPSYVRLRADNPKYPVRPGDNFVIVTYYATPGAQVTSVMIDGTIIGVTLGREHGLMTVSTGVELPVGRSRKVSITLREPAAHAAVSVLRQPLVRPASVRVNVPNCR